MRVFTWACSDETVPSGHRALARIMLNDGSWHPVVISAASEAAALDAATKWWGDELARAVKGRKPKGAASAPEVPTVEVEDPGDVV